MPKDRYRLYHVEKAKGGIALTMTAGSAVVSRDSPPAFGNLLLWRDDIVPWLRRLTDECHDARRGGDDPDHASRPPHVLEPRRLAAGAVALAGARAGASRVPENHRGLGHRAHRRRLRRRRAARAGGGAGRAGDRGVRPSARRVLVAGHQPARRRVRRQPRQPHALLARRAARRCAPRSGEKFLVGVRMVADEDWDRGLSRADGMEIARRFKASGLVDFLNIIRGHIETDNALTDVIPIAGMRSAPHLDFAGEVRAATQFPVFHAARISDVATARHAIADGQARHGGHDARADRRSAYRAQGGRGCGAAHPPLRRRDLLPRPHLRGQRGAVHPQPRHRPRGDDAAHRRAQRGAAPARRRGRRRTGGAGSRARRGRARPCGDAVRGDGEGRRPDPAGHARAATARPDRHRRLAAGGTGTPRRRAALFHLCRRRTTCWRNRPTW